MENPTGLPTDEMPTAGGDNARLGMARYLAWVLLVLILGFAVGLAIIFGNRARDTLLTKQKNFAGIMAEHLNQQIFVRFSIPVVASYGRQNLAHNAQYMMLQQTVEDLTHGLQVQSLRIWDNQGQIKFSYSDREEVGFQSPESEIMAMNAIESQGPLFAVDGDVSFWQSMVLFFQMKSGEFSLRTIYPMRPVYSLKVENTATYYLETGPSLGILEFTQDITQDMTDVIRFQWSIVGITLASALLLFFLLMFFLRRAEAALTQRLEERQRLLLELHQHEKLAGMGRVVAGIAHEIRNPLGIIKSSAELLLTRSSGGDQVTTKILGAIFDESKRLSQTVSDFLDYARPKQPQQERVNLSKSLGDVLAFLETETNAKGIAVETSLISTGGEDEGLWTLGDKDLLYRAFYNVLVNSIQAMEEGGAITVTGRPAMAHGKRWIELRFEDSGPGFPPEDRQRILDPFVTTKDGGTGLGLPIVNNIIASHGGSVHLEDAPHGGAMVRVLLPSAPASNLFPS